MPIAYPFSLHENSKRRQQSKRLYRPGNRIKRYNSGIRCSGGRGHRVCNTESIFQLGFGWKEACSRVSLHVELLPTTFGFEHQWRRVLLVLVSNVPELVALQHYFNVLHKMVIRQYLKNCLGFPVLCVRGSVSMQLIIGSCFALE